MTPLVRSDQRRASRTGRAGPDARAGTRLALPASMGIARQAFQYGQRRLALKMLRAVPWLGAVVAIATVGMAIRREGASGGTVVTALGAIPYLGGAKTLAEVVRGRDFISDRRPATAAQPVTPRTPRPA